MTSDIHPAEPHVGAINTKLNWLRAGVPTSAGDPALPMKLDRPVPKIVNARPETIWLTRRVIEANACGTMVLASDVPGLRDAVRDNETGLLYEFGNIRDLTEKISLLLGEKERREALAAEAFRWASTFDWDRAAAGTLRLLEERAPHDILARQAIPASEELHGLFDPLGGPEQPLTLRVVAQGDG